MTEEPVWRSLLYVPAHIQKYVAKAHTYGADCIQLDLEDSVPPDYKARARAGIAEAARVVRQSGADVVVRINRSLSLAVRDIEAVIGPDVDAIAITKVAESGHLRLLDELVGEIEPQRGVPLGHTRFIAMVETPAAFLDMRQIATATSRLIALNLGSEDFALEVGMLPSEEVLLMPKQQLIFAARSAGLLPLGFISSAATLDDLDAFRRMVRRSRQFGFTGASCIHPRQVAILNEEYAPSAEEIARASHIIKESERLESEGIGAFVVDGSMIDRPVVDRARALLNRHALIEGRGGRLKSQ